VFDPAVRQSKIADKEPHTTPDAKIILTSTVAFSSCDAGLHHAFSHGCPSSPDISRLCSTRLSHRESVFYRSLTPKLCDLSASPTFNIPSLSQSISPFFSLQSRGLKYQRQLELIEVLGASINGVFCYYIDNIVTQSTRCHANNIV
jgi:hypothetical protein